MATSSTRLRCYLSHPLGYLNGKATGEYCDNLQGAGEWLSFLVAATKWVVVAPWYFYVVALPGKLRPRAFADQLDVLETCELVAFCGYWSPHMRMELDRAERRGVPTVDLTPIGRLPPLGLESHLAAALVDARMAA